jgi:hypothetical protein
MCNDGRIAGPHWRNVLECVFGCHFHLINLALVNIQLTNLTPRVTQRRRVGTPSWVHPFTGSIDPELIKFFLGNCSILVGPSLKWFEELFGRVSSLWLNLLAH